MTATNERDMREPTMIPFNSPDDQQRAIDAWKKNAKAATAKIAQYTKTGNWMSVSAAASDLTHYAMMLSYAEQGFNYQHNAARRNAEREDERKTLARKGQR